MEEHMSGRKKYINFTVKNKSDRDIKEDLTQNFKKAQNLFDKKCRYFKHAFNKQKIQNLENLGNEKNKVDMWATLKRLENNPSPKAAMEIVRADNTISNDVKEVLERWHSDIS